ncbi:FAD-dependent oxidoreductase [Agromyces laixinhei]|uniref:FAD-dependent oxidoreductase n=1 Tax=Agromyces laixinhei TaxID=2585717 RepID=UPI0012EDB102|nr:FAD-dependent oxidoreductase [Agromyces laixinhei]
MTLIDLTAPKTIPSRLQALPVAIIGAGPIGLAAAANLVERGIDFVLLEAGDRVGASVAQWGHTRLFSPWRHLVDPASRRLLAESGWAAPPSASLPTGAELIERFLAPLAALPAIAHRIRLGVEVTDVTREGMDRTRTTGRSQAPFLLRLRTVDGVEELTARAVIDASGTYRTPNSLGSSGLDPLGIADVEGLVSHALPDVLGADRALYAGRHTIVVGAGHSAANTLLQLDALAEQEPGTRVTWAIRNATAARVTTSPDDELPARASLGARVDAVVAAGRIELVDRFEIVRLGRGSRDTSEESVAVVTGRRGDGLETITADRIVNATGFRPNLEMLREIRLELDDIVEAPRRLAPLIDPNVHSCGTVEPHGFGELTQPERDFFIVGMKSYGRAPTFLLATGYEQVRSVTAWLDGDEAAARAVELELPATGVCSTSADTQSGSCCGTSAC